MVERFGSFEHDSSGAKNTLQHRRSGLQQAFIMLSERGNTHAPILISCHFLLFNTGGFKCHAVIFTGSSFLMCVCVPCSVYVANVCPCAFYKAIHNDLKSHLLSIYRYFYRDTSIKNGSSLIISSPYMILFQTSMTLFNLWNTKKKDILMMIF